MIKDYLKVVSTFVLNNKISSFITFAFILQTLFAGRVWFWNIFSVIPPISFTLLYLFLLFWIIAKKQRLGVVFLIICLPLALNSSDLTFKILADNPNTNISSIKVFNWNTEFWEKENKEEFFNFLLKQDADVYHLQEHIKLSNGYFIELEDMNEIRSYFEGYTVIKKTEFLTITRLPIVKSYTEGETYYLRVDVMADDKVLSLYNVHLPVQINPAILPNIYRFTVDLKHRYDFRNQEYEKLFDDVRSNTNLFYISGDFNTTRAMGKIQDVIALGKDTVHAGNNLFNSSWSMGNLKLWRIDFNIVHSNINVVEYKEVDPLSYSDHWAQKVTIQLN